VVEAVGSVPNVGWLSGNGLDLSDGVLCSPDLNPVRDGVSVESVWAVGDVARFPNLALDAAARRVEHWNIPAAAARYAARRVVDYLGTGYPQDHRAHDPDPGLEQPSVGFQPLPTFWSNQGALSLQSYGLPALGHDDVRGLDDPERQGAAIGYFRDDRLVGVVLINLNERAAHYRAVMADCLWTGANVKRSG